MSIAIRSPLVTGVAFAAASAIVISPVNTITNATTVTALDVAPMAMSRGIDNPFEVFRPVLEQTITDLGGIAANQLRNPAPIARQFLMNQTRNLMAVANTGLDAGVTLGTAALQLPSTLVTAVMLLAKNQPDEAFDALERGTLVPVLDVMRSVINTAQEIVTQQLNVVMRLVEVVPQDIMRILNATLSAGDQILRASIHAVSDVVSAALKLDLVGVVNAVTHGIANVAMVTEQVTIGGDRAEEYRVAADGTSRAIEIRRLSIRQALEYTQRDIADALAGGNIKEKAVAESAPAPATIAPDDALGQVAVATSNDDPGQVVEAASNDAKAAAPVDTDVPAAAVKAPRTPKSGHAPAKPVRAPKAQVHAAVAADSDADAAPTVKADRGEKKTPANKESRAKAAE